MMHVMMLTAVLMSVSVFAGNSNKKSATCDADVKQGAAATAEVSTAVQSLSSEVDEKRNKAREDLIAKTAKRVALRCAKASPWGDRLMIDLEGEPTEAFKKAAALPAEKLEELIAFAKEQPYFCTSGYMLLREIYEGVLEVTLPYDINQRVVSAQQILPQITNAAMGQLRPEVALIVIEYAHLQTLKSIPDILDTYHRNQWHITDEEDDWFSPDIPDCAEFCTVHKNHYSFPYDKKQLTRVRECGFVPEGNGLHPDRIVCLNCRALPQSDTNLGSVTGLFLTWKILTRYHKPGCVRKKERVAAPARRQRTGRYEIPQNRLGEYGYKVPNNVTEPAEFLVYLLRHVDIFARSHLPQGRAAQTDIETRSYLWVKGLAKVEDCVLKAEAMIQYFKQKEVARALVVGSGLAAAAHEYFMASDAKKRKSSAESATPE